MARCKCSCEIITGQITTPANELLALGRQVRRHHTNSSSNASRVRGLAVEPNSNSRSSRNVFINQRSSVEAVDRYIEVSIVIEIGQRHALRNRWRIKTPMTPALLE